MHNPFMYKLLLLYKYRSSCCSVPIPILVKITISVVDIIADPIIGTPLHRRAHTYTRKHYTHENTTQTTHTHACMQALTLSLTQHTHTTLHNTRYIIYTNIHGSSFTICFISSSNPICSILSASSITKH